MSGRKINLTKILEEFGETDCDFDSWWYTNESIYVAMIEFGKQLLELAAENAELSKEFIIIEGNMGSWVDCVNKQSILNTIKQIE